MRYAFVLTYIALCFFAAAVITLPNVPHKAKFEEKATQYDVEIIRDSLGIPHIYGQSHADTAFGLGYAQSEDDFSTLQTVILATRGTLAAENGYKAAKTDFVVQFMGVWDAVNSRYEQDVPEHIKALAQAYADGVNLYAAQNPNEVSDFLLPVTAKDLIAGFTFKTPMFYGFDDQLGKLVNADEPLALAKQNENALLVTPQESLPLGSQGIAIAPKRSADNSTYLLVNSHQPLTGPVAWYEARLHSAEGWDVVGSTFPGAPVIIHGHNRNIGWSNTVNKPDLVDFYKLIINPDNSNQYKLDDQWHDFETKQAEMIVKFWGPLRWTFNKDIKLSQHGPVMETEHGAYAVRWAGMNEVRTLEFMHAVNMAKDKDEFEAALAMNAMPSINYVYADIDGNIAHYYNAMFPKRISGWQWDKVLPGDNSELIWQGYWDFDMMPKTINPQSGFVYNANNPPNMSTDGDDDVDLADYPASMGIETFITNRAYRIEEIAKSLDAISFQDLKNLKFDLNYSEQSNQIKQLKYWLKAVDTSVLSPQEKQAWKDLHEWDYSTDKHNELAALAVMTLDPVQKARGSDVDLNETTKAFQSAVKQLTQYYGRHKVKWGGVMRLQQGDVNLPIDGGPDILRAVYGKGMNEQGQMINRAGDGFMMFVRWDQKGQVSSQAAHQFGAASTRSNSTHYNDQMNAFVEHELREVILDRSKVKNTAKSIYHPLNPQN
ncbi:acylase [Bermanella marisrubri]|nr:penicillin acylase family protein [Bermanella marisrubri]QIZ85331.1 acylase [Bermanella marisrubri]